MRMKIVVADWSAPTLPATISLASAARMRSSCVDVLGFGSGGGLTMVSRAIVNSPAGWISAILKASVSARAERALRR